MIALAEQNLVGVEGHGRTLGTVAPAHDRAAAACQSEGNVLESQHLLDYRVALG